MTLVMLVMPPPNQWFTVVGMTVTGQERAVKANVPNHRKEGTIINENSVSDDKTDNTHGLVYKK